MALYRAMYLSRRVDEGDSSVLTGILRSAAAKNSQNDITGLLLSDEEYFLQILEGRMAILSATLQKVCMDPRHSDMRILLFHKVKSRLFPTWTMGSLSREKVSRSKEGAALLEALVHPQPDASLMIDRPDIENLFLWFSGQQANSLAWANKL